MKKFRLTHLLSLIVLLLMGISTLSCSNEISNDADSSAPLHSQAGIAFRDDAEIDTVFAVESTKAAAINFTKEIKAFYSPGMSYSDLKNELDPVGHLSSITPAGDALLHEAYGNIVENVHEEDMNGLKMTEALHYILKIHVDAGIVKLEDVDFEKGSRKLFGLGESYETTARAGGCKWYQVGCLLSAFWNWLAADANGAEPGTTTNGSILATVMGIVTGIGTIIGMLAGGN